jgi:hypothetical protein
MTSAERTRRYRQVLRDAPRALEARIRKLEAALKCDRAKLAAHKRANKIARGRPR